VHLGHYENIFDPWHHLVLHQMMSGDQFEGALMQGARQIEFEKTALGFVTTSSKTCQTVIGLNAMQNVSSQTLSSSLISGKPARYPSTRSVVRSSPG